LSFLSFLKETIMVKMFMRFLMSALLVAFTATAIAQCIPPNGPGPPRLWDGVRGCYVPQGTPAVSHGYQQQWPQQVIPSNYGGVAIPSGVMAGQAFNTVVNGVSMRCSILDRAASAAAQGLLAGGLGYVGEKILNRKDHRVSARLAVAGMASGATLTCDPNIVDDTPRQVPVGTPQQGQFLNQGNGCTHNPGTQQGVLNLPGHPKHGQTVCARPGDVNVRFF
jgi:hypothetical protein